MRKTLTILTLALAATTAQADHAWHLQVHTKSHHFDARTNGKQWEDGNYGIGLRREFNADWSLQGGVYRNSIGRTTLYATADWTPLQHGAFSAGVFAGLRTGYEKGVQPAAGGLVRWQGERTSITVRMAPKVSSTGSAMVALELGWKF